MLKILKSPNLLIVNFDEQVVSDLQQGLQQVSPKFRLLGPSLSYTRISSRNHSSQGHPQIYHDYLTKPVLQDLAYAMVHLLLTG